MISLSNINSLKNQITNNIIELNSFINSYNKKIKLYNIYIKTIEDFKDIHKYNKKLNIQELKNRINIFNEQIDIINNLLNILDIFLKDYYAQNNIENSFVDTYNQIFSEIKNNYINNCFLEENFIVKYIYYLISEFSITFENIKENYNTEITQINNQNSITNEINKDTKLKNNDTLLISETKGKVFLPYTAKEILKIFNNSNNKYQTVEDVIESEFTRNLSDYKVQFISRYNETMKLAREKEKYGLIDSIALATEMMKNRFLHPAIISACRNLNDLDVYLDCLDKNELDEFKIFNIKYELYPMVLKHKKKKITIIKNIKKRKI